MLTPYGFFSVVEKPEDKASGSLTIRARVRSDLEALRDAALPALGEIEKNKGTDYRWRAKAPRADVAQAMAKLVTALDYSNFKNAVAARQGKKRAHLYGELWNVLYRLQEDPTFEAPPKPAAVTVPKATAYGGVLVDAEGRVLLREPKGHYGGYVWTFAKGGPDKGETPEQCALREVLEETGYKARIFGALPHAFAGDTSSTAFFLMEPEGPQGAYHDETSQTVWVDFDKAAELVAMTKSVNGKARDLAVLEATRKTLKSLGRLSKGG